ncbi:DUF3854 domain-containing protein [Oxynema aestuarii]|jgi:putative DNA primase/helicase|uniref:DUF3854 domain-containing protein n=1 Tax=Oxynema aestuarii AP17 TaxID=2064643 RepID=A0A6H1U2N5_9CYAN|nr:DUF3854 domain-containing protein [Oxynema aestuarii]QIZ72293.1 DUF3854 domain-containing protein [Oxynema aestuarii AP17]
MVTQQVPTPRRLSDLSDRHYRYCVEERGLDPDWIVANCRTVGAEEAGELLGYPAKSEGIWLQGSAYQGQFKPDRPWRSPEGSSKRAPKYRSPLGEYDAMLPRHPEDPDYWEVGSLKQTAFQIDGHPCLLLTEGFFKAIAGCAHGLPTVALLGVEMGLTSASADPQGKRYLVPELERLARAGFGFAIAFDADCATNPAVNWAQFKLARQLKCFNVPVYSLTGLWDLRDGKGLDDYLHRHGVTRFIRDVIGATIDIDTWERQFEQTKPPQVTRSRSRKRPSPRELGLAIAEKYQFKWAFHDEQLVWRQFDGKAWHTLRDGVFAQMVFEEIEARNVEFDTARYVKNTIDILKLKLTVPYWKTWDRSRYIAFDNGILDLKTANLLEHHPRYRFTSHLKRAYLQPPARAIALNPLEQLRQYCPHTYRYMMWAMDSDPKRVLKLLAIINGVLTRRFYDLEMFVHLVGEPGSGKSTFARLLQKMVGKGNYESSSLKKLSQDYEIAKIINSQLVVCPDEDRKFGGFGGLKALTGGDNISYREIYKHPASSPFYGTIVILSNQAIFAGDTTGLDRRTCLVSFPNRLKKHQRDPQIELSIEGELSHLTWIVLSLRDRQINEVLRGLGIFHIPEFQLQAWQLCVQTNSAAAHLEEFLVNKPHSYTPVVELYAHYQEFCKQSGAIAFSRERYLQDLTRIANHNLEWQGLRRDGLVLDGKRTQVFWGIHLRNGVTDNHLPTPSEQFQRV